VGWWIDREVAIGQCDVSPCTNLGTIRGQRDAAVGLTVGALIATSGLAVVGALLLALGGEGEAERSWRCGLAGLGVGCAGRF